MTENIALVEPKFLGFIFNVKRSEVGYLKAIIEETLKRMDIPYDGIDVYGNVDLPITKIWSKERIIPAIAKDRDYLIEKSKKHSK